jgi:polyphosphate kinase
VGELFNLLTGSSKQQTHRALLVAPGDMHRKLLAKIEREIERQREGGNGHLIFKCNGLTDEEMTAALYRASQAGVRVDLLVRGVCSVRPGIGGLSDSMTVRSIVGRFLEHHRFYYFYNGGDEELYAGSADLMDRNLHRRIETLFPIMDAKLLRHLRDDVLELYLRDNVQARELRADGTYERVSSEGALPVNAQLTLMVQSERGR